MRNAAGFAGRGSGFGSRGSGLAKNGPLRTTSILAIALASAGCGDGYVRARVKVVSTQGAPIAGALIRLDKATEFDHSRYTDANGCAHFAGVVAPVRQVAVMIGKDGYTSQRTSLRTIQPNCLVARLAREGDEARGGIDRLALDDCPCEDETGYEPTMTARFKVRDTSGTPVEVAALRQSDGPRHPWSQVTDANGCLGVSWIVSARVRSTPLVLEKAGYQPVRLEVPTLNERCYAVSLSRQGDLKSSTVTPVDQNACECEPFSGKTIWPQK